MNKFIASGNVTKDPAVTISKNGKTIVNFLIAVRREMKNQDGQYDSDFFNCVAFGFTADYVGNYITKGNKVLICGRLQNESWEKDGVKHYATKVIVENCESLTPKQKASEDKGLESFGKPIDVEEVIPF